MAFRSNKDLKIIVHPYLFVLKEGKKIQSNLLDYSLLMLQVSSPEIIPSPCKVEMKPVLKLHDQDFFSHSTHMNEICEPSPKKLVT